MALTPYTPTTWVNDSEPDIDAANLNKIEQGIEDAIDGVNGILNALSSQIENDSAKFSSSAALYAVNSSLNTVSTNLASLQGTVSTLNSNLALKANSSDFTPSRTTLNSVINAVYIDRTGNFRVVSVYNDASTSITIAAYAKYGIGTLPVGDRINRRFSAPVFARNASNNTIFTGVTLLLDNTDNNIYLVNQTSSDITFNQMYAEKAFVVGIT